MGRSIATIKLTPVEKAELVRRLNSPTSTVRDHLRASIILECASGKKQQEVAESLSISLTKVNRWSKRFSKNGLDGLRDIAGKGRKSNIPESVLNKIVTEVTQPPQPCARWSTRTMARHAGVSRSTVNRIWNKNELKPHLTKTFKLSNDPQFEQKFWDVIGLYLDPPEKAIILCCDEKSQCQALERTQPSLPLGIGGYLHTRTHDYKRHGTITLFAALNYLDGKIISRTETSHTNVEWLRFLKQIEKETPKGLSIHLIIDNYATHKHENVKNWLSKHKRFNVHYTPTGSSWMNLVERFFRDLTVDVVRDGSFESVKDLVADIEEYLSQRNLNPQPYRWKADGEVILRKIAKARNVRDSVKNSI